MNKLHFAVFSFCMSIGALSQTMGYLSLTNAAYSVTGDGFASSEILPSQKISAGVLTDYGLLAGIQLATTNLHYSNSTYSFQGIGVNLGYNMHFGFIGTRILAQAELRTGGLQQYQGAVYPLETSQISVIIRPELYYRILQGNNPVDITVGYDLSLMDLDPNDQTSYTYRGIAIGVSIGLENLMPRVLGLRSSSSTVRP